MVESAHFESVLRQPLQPFKNFLLGRAVVIDRQFWFNGSGHWVGFPVQHVSFESLNWIDASPSLLQQECKLIVADFSLAGLIQVVEKFLDVIEGHLETHVLDSLSELIDADGLGVVDVEESEALLEIYESFSYFVRDHY